MSDDDVIALAVTITGLAGKLRRAVRDAHAAGVPVDLLALGAGVPEACVETWLKRVEPDGEDW